MKNKSDIWNAQSNKMLDDAGKAALKALKDVLDLVQAQPKKELILNISQETVVAEPHLYSKITVAPHADWMQAGWRAINDEAKTGKRILTVQDGEIRENRWFNYDVLNCHNSDKYTEWETQKSPELWQPLPAPPTTTSNGGKDGE